MKTKRIISALMLLLVFLALPMQAMAEEESVTVGVSFTVENTPGTVVIEGVDGAPLPEQTELSDVLEGTFEITYTRPGDYEYKVYQKQGLDDYTAYYKTYDDTVYNVLVSIFLDENEELYGVVTATLPGADYKPDDIAFTNESEEANLLIEKSQALNDEKPTTKQIDVKPGDKITYYITVSNNTEGSVYDVTVTDGIPAELELVEGTISHKGSEADRVVTWNLGIIGPGETVTVSFATTVPKDLEVETKWHNFATGTFVNQTGRVTIDTQEMKQTETVGKLSTLSTLRSVKSALRELANENDQQTIEMDTNEVVAVFSPTAPPPQTGDNSNIPLLIAIEAVSLAGILLFLFLFFKRRNKDDEEEAAEQ